MSAVVTQTNYIIGLFQENLLKNKTWIFTHVIAT